ncbi:hypothetical protein BC938DRAFT_474102 [Jimgerdemannia flammicorona]|uniref:Uncharacterized protein n=1 Tax=Jimgerdemannia flammicorona TaxID=994334 RepID=A0A433Q2U4_9FUNG|nr:hypothetical protein BC938DRAFT_474102 [Jimgerdemannia flammicorona]
MPRKHISTQPNVRITEMSKTYSLSADIATRILSYIKMDNEYSCNMYNFILVETSWHVPAMYLLYTHLKFASYNNLIKC